MPSKIHQFYATSIGGLEDVVLDNCQNALIGLEKKRIERGGRVGRVFFTYERSPKQLLNIHSALGIFAIVAEVFGITVGKTSIERIEKKISGLSLDTLQRLAKGGAATRDLSRYNLNVTLAGRHRFSTAQLREAIQRVLEEQYGLLKGENGLPLYLQVTGKRAIFGLRLVGRSMQSALAHCLVHLMGIQARDRVIDLNLFGSGNEECDELDGLQRLIVLSETLNKTRAAKQIVISRAGQIPIIAESMAYGMAYRQLGRANLSLGELDELARVVRPGGVVGLVVQAPQYWGAKLREAHLPFEIMAALPINLRGRHCGLLLLERLEEFSEQADLLTIEWDDL